MSYDYFRPSTLSEAQSFKKQNPGAMWIAGGTDLMVRLKDVQQHPDALISLRSIAEMTGVEPNGPGGMTRIGAMTSLTDLIADPHLNSEYAVLVSGARRVGSTQIRNSATIGGNLCNCSPCADTATPLLVLDARVRLLGASGSREVPIADFFVGPGKTCAASEELLTDILLPGSTKSSNAVFFKKGRVKMDLAIASLSVLLEMDGKTCEKARVAAGSVAPVPLRLHAVEEMLEGEEITVDVLAKARQLAEGQIAPIGDIRASASYRRQLIGVFLTRAVSELLERGSR